MELVVLLKMESAYTSLGDKIYIIRGYGETGKRNKNSVEVYDTKADTWSTAAPGDLILTMQVAEARGCVANPGGAACAELMQVGEDASTSSY